LKQNDNNVNIYIESSTIIVFRFVSIHIRKKQNKKYINYLLIFVNEKSVLIFKFIYMKVIVYTKTKIIDSCFINVF